MVLRKRLFGIPEPIIQNLTDVLDLDRALRLGRPSRHGNRRNHRRARFKFKKLKFTCFFCLDHKTAKRRNNKRRNDETCSKRLIYRQDHHSGTVPVRKRSFFRFEREFRRFVILIACRVESANSFA